MSGFARRNQQAAARPVMSPGTVVTPGDLAGLTLWLKADAITGLSDGAAVASWLDSSGNIFNATGSTGSQPVFSTNASPTGLPGVTFTSDQLNSAAPSGGGEQTVVAIVKLAAVTGVQTIRAGGSGALQCRLDGGTPRMLAEMQSGLDAGSAAITAGNAMMVAYTFSANNDTYAYRVGLTESGYGSQALSLTANQTIVGASSGGEYLNGILYELATWSRVLTPLELDQILEGFDYKWNGTIPPSWTPPAIPVITTGAFSSTGTPTITGTAAIRSTVNLTIDSQNYSTTTTGTGFWSVPVTSTLASGDYQIDVSASNPSGTSGLSTKTLKIATIPAITATGKFAIDSWRIKDPYGQEFIPIGANVNGIRWVWNGPTIGNGNIAKNTLHWTCIRLNCMMPNSPEVWPVDQVGGEIGTPPPEIYTTNDNLDGIIQEWTNPDPITGRRCVVMVTSQWMHAGRMPNRTPGSAPDGSGRSELEGITAWLVSVANTYKTNPYVWINLLNEPGDDPMSGSLQGTKDYYDLLTQDYTDMITAIRTVAPNMVIVVDSANYANDIPTEQAGDMGAGPVPFTMVRGGVTYPWTYAANYMPGLINQFGPSAGYGPVISSIHLYSRWGWAPNVGNGLMNRTDMDARLRDYIERMHALNIPFFFGEMGPEPFNFDSDTVAAESALMFGGDYTGVIAGHTDSSSVLHRVGVTWWHGDPGAWGMGLRKNDGNWFDIRDRTDCNYFGTAHWDFAYSVT